MKSTSPAAVACSQEESPPRTDHLLLQQCRTGDQDAARALYRRYAGRLRALVVAQCGSELQARFDPDDIVQSVFRTFFQGVKESGYDVPEDQELWGLLFVMALHKVRNQASYHRAAKRDVGVTLGGESLAGQVFASDESSLRFLEMLIDDELRDYPPVNRQVVRMRIEGYDVPEIVRTTGRSRRTVERVLQEFRKQLSDSR
ncbi:MAG: RNA polymerase sigma factor [Gemmataceae bacterium]